MVALKVTISPGAEEVKATTAPEASATTSLEAVKVTGTTVSELREQVAGSETHSAARIAV